MLPEELAVAREGVCFRARGPARPLDGSRPRSRARRTFLYGEVLLFVAIAVAIVTIYATFAAPSLAAATLPPSPPSASLPPSTKLWYSIPQIHTVP